LISKAELFEIVLFCHTVYIIFTSSINTRVLINTTWKHTYFFLYAIINTYYWRWNDDIEISINAIKLLCWIKRSYILHLTHSQTAFDEMLVHNCAVFLFLLNRARVRPQNRTREMEQVTFRDSFMIHQAKHCE